MSARKEYLENMTIRELRIYGRKNGYTIYQKWTKKELVSALMCTKA